VNVCPAPVETVAAVGEIPTTIPSVSVTTAEAVAPLSVLLEAVMVMLEGEGIMFGAMYKPVGEIVPAPALPPATPPANHVTLLFDAPVTVAWNCCDWPRDRLTCAGCKTIVTTAGPVEVVPAQPGISMAAIEKITRRSRFRFSKGFNRANVVAAGLKVIFSHRPLPKRAICGGLAHGMCHRGASLADSSFSTPFAHAFSG
jgi:hypothetical protein